MTELTSQQQRVAELVADGLSDKQIAAVLGVSLDDVKGLQSRIAKRLRLDPAKNRRVQIAVYVARTLSRTMPDKAS